MSQRETNTTEDYKIAFGFIYCVTMTNYSQHGVISDTVGSLPLAINVKHSTSIIIVYVVLIFGSIRRVF